jgi:biopolymer transport protein ExbD
VNIPTSRRAIQSGGFNLQLTPLIDCVFLLLIYFLWSSSFTRGELFLSGRLPPASGTHDIGAGLAPPESDFEPIVVRVIRRGSQIAWTMQDASIPSPAALRQSLENAARIKADIPLIISPSSDVPWGDVIEAFDLARIAGLTKIQIAASALPGTQGPVER